MLLVRVAIPPSRFDVTGMLQPRSKVCQHGIATAFAVTCAGNTSRSSGGPSGPTTTSRRPGSIRIDSLVVWDLATAARKVGFLVDLDELHAGALHESRGLRVLVPHSSQDRARCRMASRSRGRSVTEAFASSALSGTRRRLCTHRTRLAGSQPSEPVSARFVRTRRGLSADRSGRHGRQASCRRDACDVGTSNALVCVLLVVTVTGGLVRSSVCNGMGDGSLASM